jgi:CheY-like chemotaxis protein
VLLVDDEPTVRLLAAEALLEFGYTVIEALDGAGGLKVRQSDARIDLLITDVGLSRGMNCRQEANAGRAVRPDLKVLFITCYAEDVVIRPGRLEAGTYLQTKSFSADVLAGRIRDIIAGSG